MIRVRISQHLEEVDIEGTGQELVDLIKALESFIASEHSELTTLTDDSFDPHPYYALAGLIFRKGHGHLEAKLENKSLIISGSNHAIQSLADNLPAEADQPEAGVNYHVHFDKTWGTLPLSKDFPDMTLTLRK